MTRSTVSFHTLLKAVAVISAPALLVLAGFVLTENITIAQFMYGYAGVLVLSGFVVHPFLSNISTLTHYVRNLSHDRKVEAPDLSLLSNVGELSEALSVLQRSWERKKQQMESIITEREILVDTLPDILIMVNDDKMVVRTNRAARAIFGQNLAYHPLKEVIPNETLLDAVTSVTQDLKGRVVEFPLDMETPRVFLAIIERFPIPSAGGISLIITLNDITERKRTEQMRADFVANASHEIRTPLASIKGFIETLQGPAKDDAKAREEFLKVMAEQADRMSRLISDLLSLSKIEMSAHSRADGKVDVTRILRAEVQNFERAALEKKIQLRLDLHELPMARGETSEITQVVYNLVGNAIKYGNPNTEVTITARTTTMLPPDPQLRNVSRAICVSVRDRGEGIPKEHLPRLTERFYRVDSARTRNIGGTGLGLAIVKHILNRHQGVLIIDSNVSEGSTFSFYLHIHEE